MKFFCSFLPPNYFLSKDLRGVQLKRQMQNDVIPKLIQRVNSASGLDRIDKNIKGVDSVQASNNPVLACAKKGDVYDKNAKDEGKCCKSLSS